MPEFPTLKPRQVVAALERAGFYRVRQRGSHLQLKRGNLLVTVPTLNRPGIRLLSLPQTRLAAAF